MGPEPDGEVLAVEILHALGLGIIEELWEDLVKALRNLVKSIRTAVA